MQISKLIETEIGVLWGRDCVYLDHTSKTDAGTLLLRGTINCRIVRNYLPPPGWEEAEDLPYELLFRNVLGFQMLELDAWGTQNEDLSALSESCFEEVENSMWLKRLHDKLVRLRHLRLATYDDVLEVLCETYTWQFGDKAR